SRGRAQRRDDRPVHEPIRGPCFLRRKSNNGCRQRRRNRGEHRRAGGDMPRTFLDLEGGYPKELYRVLRREREELRRDWGKTWSAFRRAVSRCRLAAAGTEFGGGNRPKPVGIGRIAPDACGWPGVQGSQGVGRRWVRA